eukprot:scaffold238043_cov21-Tisochrysis_lutea.AAC.3
MQELEQGGAHEHTMMYMLTVQAGAQGGAHEHALMPMSTRQHAALQVRQGRADSTWWSSSQAHSS